MSSPPPSGTSVFRGDSDSGGTLRGKGNILALFSARCTCGREFLVTWLDSCSVQTVSVIGGKSIDFRGLSHLRCLVPSDFDQKLPYKRTHSSYSCKHTAKESHLFHIALILSMCSFLAYEENDENSTFRTCFVHVLSAVHTSFWSSSVCSSLLLF